MAFDLGQKRSATVGFGKVPIWVFHGGSDSVVPVCRSRNMVAALWQCDGNVRYKEYPGVDHNGWTPTYADKDVLKWFFAQSKLESAGGPSEAQLLHTQLLTPNS